jgi:hypothetical protein
MFVRERGYEPKDSILRRASGRSLDLRPDRLLKNRTGCRVGSQGVAICDFRGPYFIAKIYNKISSEIVQNLKTIVIFNCWVKLNIDGKIPMAGNRDLFVFGVTFRVAA